MVHKNIFVAIFIVIIKISHSDVTLDLIVLEIFVAFLYFVEKMYRYTKDLVDRGGGELLQMVVEHEDMLKFFLGEWFEGTLFIYLSLLPTLSVSLLIFFQFQLLFLCHDYSIFGYTLYNIVTLGENFKKVLVFLEKHQHFHSVLDIIPS